MEGASPSRGARQPSQAAGLANFAIPPPFWQTVWCGGFVVFFVVLQAEHLWRNPLGCWCPILVALFMGDLYVGVLHCVVDNPKSKSIPPLRNASIGFLLHHDHPRATTTDAGWGRLICDSIRIQILWCVVYGVMTPHTTETLNMFGLLLFVAAYCQGWGHAYAHAPSCSRPWCVRVLQRCHLLLPPRMHHQHHKSPYAVRFAIPNGLSNYVLDPWLGQLPYSVVLVLFGALTLFLTPVSCCVCRWLLTVGRVLLFQSS